MLATVPRKTTSPFCNPWQAPGAFCGHAHALATAGAMSHMKRAIDIVKDVRRNIADIVHCKAQKNRGLKGKKIEERFPALSARQPHFPKLLVNAAFT